MAAPNIAPAEASHGPALQDEVRLNAEAKAELAAIESTYGSHQMHLARGNMQVRQVYNAVDGRVARLTALATSGHASQCLPHFERATHAVRAQYMPDAASRHAAGAAARTRFQATVRSVHESLHKEEHCQRPEKVGA